MIRTKEEKLFERARNILVYSKEFAMAWKKAQQKGELHELISYQCYDSLFSVKHEIGKARKLIDEFNCWIVSEMNK